jgi:hypothetical protein
MLLEYDARHGVRERLVKLTPALSESNPQLATLAPWFLALAGSDAAGHRLQVGGT